MIGIPWPVVTGLVALGLAEAGHTGPRNILDSANRYRFPDELSLGASPHICQAYFKLYAYCPHIHALIDALLGLIAAHGLTPSDVAAVEVEPTAARSASPIVCARPTSSTSNTASLTASPPTGARRRCCR